MDELAQEVIKERFDALPESIKEIIMSSNYQNTLLEISKQHNLNVEQMGILERETTMVMMGLTNPNSFEVELIRELGFEKEKVHLIVTDISERIFLKIRDLLKLMYTPPGAVPSIEEGPAIPASSGQPSEKILSAAGIKILEVPELPKPTGGIIAQKLSGDFRMPSATTEHTLPEVSKEEKPMPQKPKVDPYREPVD